jgi:hypothetical protein
MTISGNPDRRDSARPAAIAMYRELNVLGAMPLRNFGSNPMVSSTQPSGLGRIASFRKIARRNRTN